MEGLSNRIDKVCEVYRLNYKRLAENLGVSSTAIYSIINGKSEPGAKILIGLEELGVNSSWVLTGNGEMLKNEANTPKTFQPNINVDYLMKQLEQKDSIIKTLQGIIDSQLFGLGKLLDVLSSRFVFFVLFKDKFRYIKVVF